MADEKKADKKELYTSHYVKCFTEGEGFHKLAYRVYGAKEASKDVETILCVHGLTRNSHDFDFLAEALLKVLNPVSQQPRYRIVCADVPGRGDSAWLSNKTNYSYSRYVGYITTLVARITAGQPDDQGITYIGQSMGGLIGIMLASAPNTFIKRLVVDDIGALVPKEAIQRIASYVGLDPAFDSVDHVREAMKKFYSESYGPTMTETLFHHMAQHGCYLAEDNKYHLNYDPGIKQNFSSPESQNSDVDMWSVWEAVNCPVLLLRGQHSDVLRADTAKQMATRKNVKLIVYASTGHLPPLMSDFDIKDVVKWINEQMVISLTMADVVGAYT